MKHVETRWALMHDSGFLLGRFCWKDGKADDPNIRTFRTRKLAREARQYLTSYRTAQPVKVRVTVEEEQ